MSDERLLSSTHLLLANDAEAHNDEIRGIQPDGAELPTRRHPPDAKSPLSHRQTWARQERFLTAYVGKGTIWKAAPLAGINRCTVQAWSLSDTFGFNIRFADAVLDHQDRAQNWMVDRIEDPKGNRGSDGLLSHYVNAINPEKFRDRPQQNEDTQLKIAALLQQIANQDRKQIAEASSAKVIEGQAKAIKDDE